MLELGIKAPDFELPDQNGEMHKIIQPDALSRHVAFLSVIHSLLRRALLFSE